MGNESHRHLQRYCLLFVTHAALQRVVRKLPTPCSQEQRAFGCISSLPVSFENATPTITPCYSFHKEDSKTTRLLNMRAPNDERGQILFEADKFKFFKNSKNSHVSCNLLHVTFCTKSCSSCYPIHLQQFGSIKAYDGSSYPERI